MSFMVVRSVIVNVFLPLYCNTSGSTQKTKSGFISKESSAPVPGIPMTKTMIFTAFNNAHFAARVSGIQIMDIFFDTAFFYAICHSQ